MILKDDDRPIRIRPRKPPVARSEGAAWVGGYRLLMHYARASRNFVRDAGAQRASGLSRPNNHRCAVRVTIVRAVNGEPTGAIWPARARLMPRQSRRGLTMIWTASTLSANSNAGNRQGTSESGR